MYQALAWRDFLKELDASLGSGPAVTDLESVDGVGEELAEKLKEAGFHTVDDLKNAREEDLIAVDGVGKSKAAKLKDL
jgi:predicted flap endonuclease-1-like 5' DNA nuclease